jgi:hypothetical protein
MVLVLVLEEELVELSLGVEQIAGFRGRLSNPDRI